MVAGNAGFAYAGLSERFGLPTEIELEGVIVSAGFARSLPPKATA